jgi:RES domain-containing protein
VRVWRISSRRHRRFDGEGARLYGGRWNHAGTSVVYTSGSLSLAALELFVHVDTDLAPSGLIATPADIPDNVKIESINAGKLPKNWRAYPAPEALKDISAHWLERVATAVLAVPSAVIPSERNYLLNPKHQDFSRIRIENPIPFEFDPRMWK